MTCADIEILICDYVDGTLAAAQKAELEQHLSACPACAELAKDSAVAVAFLQRAADVEPPPELITRILFDSPWSKGKQKSKLREWTGALLSPILQPKFAMGMAMTILSLSMLARFVPVRQLRPADLRPSEVWNGIATRAEYTWGRTVKFYENLKIVYQIQTTLKEWQQQSEEQKPAAEKPDERKLPVKSPASTNAPAE
jgi:anti-sigma factor RsiW